MIESKRNEEIQAKLYPIFREWFDHGKCEAWVAVNPDTRFAWTFLLQRKKEGKRIPDLISLDDADILKVHGVTAIRLV